MNYKYITETFFYWTINTGNCSSLNNQKGANLCLKRTKIRLAAGFCPDPLGKLMRSPDPLTSMRPTSKRRDGRGGRRGGYI